MSEKIYIALISFCIGIIITYLLLSKFNSSKLNDFIRFIKNKIIRFIKHTLSLYGVFIVMIITYFIADKLDYSDEILPNIISTGLSILIIDFLLKERETSELEKVKVLLDYKFNSIIKNTRIIILKFINLEDIGEDRINENIIKSIIEKQNLLTENINHIYIENDGTLNEISVSKMDFTYHIGKELEKDVDSLLKNFSSYLTSDQICFLVKLQDILSKKIFKIKCSTLYSDFENSEYKVIEGILIESLMALNSLLDEGESNTKW